MQLTGAAREAQLNPPPCDTPGGSTLASTPGAGHFSPEDVSAATLARYRRTPPPAESGAAGPKVTTPLSETSVIASTAWTATAT